MSNSKQEDLNYAFNYDTNINAGLASISQSAFIGSLSESAFKFDTSNAMELFYQRGEYVYPVANPCKPGTITEIDTSLRNFFNFLKGLKEVNGIYINDALGETQDLVYEIQKVTRKISAVLRTFTQRLRNFIMGLIKELIQGAIQCLLTPLLDQIKDTVIGKILDQLMCKFDEIMDKLTNLVSDFLFALVNLAINNPVLCAIESFVNALLNNLANTIDNAIQPILAQIGDLLGGAASVIGSVFSVIDTILGYEGLLCSQPKCPEGIKEYTTNPWGSPGPGSKENFTGMLGSATKGLKGVNEWLNETFPENSNSVGSPCYTGPFECSSPQLVFFGGGGSGASGNVFVNGLGQILGVNLLSGGKSYTSAPFVSIVDPGGCGRNAQAYAILNDKGQVKKVVLTKPGSGYSNTNTGGVPIINSFVGTPNPVQIGKSITLNWNVSNFTKLSLDIPGYTNLTQSVGSASFVIDPKDVKFPFGSDYTTKTFTLTATKQNQRSAPQVVSQEYTFTVTKTPQKSDNKINQIVIPPSIDSFTGSPSIGTVLTPGSILTLSWKTTNATNVSLDPSPSTTTILPVDGSISVSIPTNIGAGILTSYLLTATNVNAPPNQQTVSQVLNYTVLPSNTPKDDTPKDDKEPIEEEKDKEPKPDEEQEKPPDDFVPEIDDIIILEGGRDYDPDDEVNLEGEDNGSELKLVTTPLGQIVKIEILNPGYGFTQIPEIQINSKNGVGAKFLVNLKFTPLNQFLAEQEIESVDPTKLVQVIDCIYK